MDKQEKLSVRQSFVQKLENKILSGELSVGEKLPPARELCHIMGVSLTVVNGSCRGPDFVLIRADN